ncbi:hypothetical protein Tco_0236240 [Tanacetum coccineum]
MLAFLLQECLKADNTLSKLDSYRILASSPTKACLMYAQARFPSSLAVVLGSIWSRIFFQWADSGGHGARYAYLWNASFRDMRGCNLMLTSGGYGGGRGMGGNDSLTESTGLVVPKRIPVTAVDDFSVGLADSEHNKHVACTISGLRAVRIHESIRPTKDISFGRIQRTTQVSIKVF